MLSASGPARAICLSISTVIKALVFERGPMLLYEAEWLAGGN